MYIRFYQPHPGLESIVSNLMIYNAELDINQPPTVAVHPPIPEHDLTRTKAPLKSLIEAGIPLAIGTDAVLNPFLNILFLEVHAANPVEGISREQAVIA